MQVLSRRLAIAFVLTACAGTALADTAAAAPRIEFITEARLCTTLLHGARLQRTELFFGRNSPTGEISEQDFQGFVDAVVTPLFPDGLTVIDGKGQFRASANGPVEKEAAKVSDPALPLRQARERQGRGDSQPLQGALCAAVGAARR